MVPNSRTDRARKSHRPNTFRSIINEQGVKCRAKLIIGEFQLVNGGPRGTHFRIGGKQAAVVFGYAKPDIPLVNCLPQSADVGPKGRSSVHQNAVDFPCDLQLDDGQFW